MKNYIFKICLVLFMGCVQSVFGQSSITSEASLNVTNFRFVDAAGMTDEGYTSNITGGFAFGYRYTLDFGLYFHAKMGMRNGGATYVYDEENYSWDLLYMDNRLGLGYEYFFDKWGLSVAMDGYLGYLFKANQRINNENYDIKQSGSLNPIDGGMVFALGGSYALNDLISIHLHLNYLLGLTNIETDNAQTTNNRMYGATLGLQFKIQ